MTSIFSDRYLGNLERVNARARGTDEQQKASHPFAKVLADIEKDTKKSASSGTLSNIKEQATGELKAELQAAESHARARLGGAPTLFLPQQETKKAVEPLPDAGVKTPPAPVNKTVKTTPPSVPIPISAAPASPPTVVRATRVAAPTTPLAVSARRVAPTAAEATVGSTKGRERAVPRPNSEIREVVISAGRTHGIDPALTLAVAAAESGFDQTAVSRDGHASKGIFQLLDSTGLEQHGLAGLDERYDPFNPEMNAHLGAGYLRRLMEMFSSETKLSARITTVPAKSAEDLEKLAVAAFNAGQGRVALAQARARTLGKDPTTFEAVAPHLPASTREYVERVLNSKLVFAGELDPSNTA